MPGKPAVVLTAAALSVTVGVLIGVVVMLGSKARQSEVGATPDLAVATAVTAATATPASPDDLTGAQISVLPTASTTATTTGAIPAPASTNSSPATHSPAAAAPSKRPASPRRSASTTAIAPATRPVTVHTTVTIGPRSRPAAPGATTSAPSSTPAAGPSRSTTTTRTTTAITPRGGQPAPGRPCPALGIKAGATGGFTVFCQRDFSNGTFAWRAVVDGGGCLSKRMTGIGTDGQLYRCRPDDRGLDHWRRA